MRKAFLLGLFVLSASCVSHSRATEFSGVDGVRGVPIEYQSTTAWSLNFLFVLPLIGDASLNTTVEEFAAEAAAQGSKRMRISQTSISSRTP